MYNPRFEKEAFKKEVKQNVKHLFRKEIDEVSQQELYQAVSYAVKEAIIDDWIATQKQYEKDDPKIVYYMSMEFLMGRQQPDQYDRLYRGEGSSGGDGHEPESAGG